MVDHQFICLFFLLPFCNIVDPSTSLNPERTRAISCSIPFFSLFLISFLSRWYQGGSSHVDTKIQSHSYEVLGLQPLLFFLGFSIRVPHSRLFHFCEWPKEKLWPDSPLNMTQMILYCSRLFPEEQTFLSGYMCEGKQQEGGCLFLFDTFWRRERNAGLSLVWAFNWFLVRSQTHRAEMWQTVIGNAKEDKKWKLNPDQWFCHPMLMPDAATKCLCPNSLIIICLMLHGSFAVNIK